MRLRPARFSLLGFVAGTVATSLVAMPAANADADALTDNLGPREIAVGEALRGGSIGSSAIMLNPAGVGLNHELVFEAGYGYRPSDSASLFNASACDSTGAMPGCFFYSHAGSNPEFGGMASDRSAHSAGLTLARPLSSRVILGSTIRYLNFSSNKMDEASAKGVNWDAGIALRLTESVNVGATGHNLWGTESSEFPRAIGGGILFRPTPSVTATFDARWKLDGEAKTGRYGGGLEYFLSPGDGQTAYPLRAGALFDRALGATYISGGLGVASMKMSFDVAARRMVKGGDETTIVASLRFYGPRTAAGEPFSPAQ